MSNNDIIQHFRKEEAPFIDYIDDIAQKASTQYRPVLTNFLNPRQVYILETIINSYDELKFQSYGGFDDAEMTRTLIYPNYYEPDNSDFEVVLCEIKYPEKFSTIHHSQVLGSLMGLGINRNTIGDIISDGDRWQFFCSKEIYNYISLNLNKIGKINVSVDYVNFSSKIKHKLDNSQNVFCILTSLRIDNVLSSVFHLSRKDSKNLVSHNLVHFNWQLLDKPDFEISLKDVVSVRGYGRFKIVSLDGITKKDKIKSSIKVIRNK
ncbi:RNA-binding protein [Apilactobacillus ozensis]|uniref:Cell division protein n=1 Tax=Apilactobacillus ozensis DSM 23829 = JCM 17196 TaxID=1423781 RepID=A0A0R2APS4_9LACO|nr:YlmH/Sll1252 family protein [Apilactobacillus ozensis]KRM68639.1 cell division protein [Apilactobacillus ozensis DSM 23829 = JCM 17196]MCK8607293.1 YlmH/Sll1252 family protein [Apilactobacillus ozensis]